MPLRQYAVRGNERSAFMVKTVTSLFRQFGALARARRGNVAMMFALALVPMTVAAGAGLDFARGMMVRQAMSEALDAASLAVGSTRGLDHDSALAMATQYFNANYKVDGSYGSPTVAIADNGYSTNGSVTITATDTMPTAIMRLVGIDTVPISTSTTVVWGQSKLWVSLVLDNSYSMTQGDSTGSKMDALKNASTQLLTILQNAAASPGDVQVSIVPFDRHINVGKSNVDASWVGWSDWEAAPQSPGTDSSAAAYSIANAHSSNPATISFEAWGPGDDCPFVDISVDRWGNKSTVMKTPFGFDCLNTASGDTIATSGSYKGKICPGLDDGNHGNSERRKIYYNGCYTSTKVTGETVTVGSGRGATCDGFSSSNCKCTGGQCKTQKWRHSWVVNAHSTWGGCIRDRDQDYDIANTTPGSGGTLFPAVNPSNCLGATVTTLGYDWNALSSQIDAMKPNDSTNQAEGVAHGWQTLTPGAPYGAPAVPTNTARYIILLSDGLNTEDRWWGDGSHEGTTEDGYIDDREKKTCDAAKADGIVIYTILLDVGNKIQYSEPLDYCASDSSKYFHLTTTSAVVTTFNQIAAQITNVRVSR
jgi:Flp pilus assembly protein TadG